LRLPGPPEVKLSASPDINITAYSDALVVLGTAGVLIPIFRKWGISPVLAYLAAGALLGPFGLGSFTQSFHPLYWFTITNGDNISGIAELGIVFLLFVVGLELSLQRLSQMRKLVAGFGGLQVLLSATLISSILVAVGLPAHAAVILAAGLSLSSTAIVLEILNRQHRMSTPLGQSVFAVLLAQDIAAIPILVFISFGASSSGSSVAANLFKAFLQAAIAVGIIVVSGRYLLRPLFRLVAATHSTELFIAAVLFVTIGTGVVAHQAGLSMALGSFIAGLLLAETEFRMAILASIEPFQGLLLGVFFFTVGMRVDVRELIQEPLLLLGCVAALIVAKAVVVAGLARVFKLPWPAAVEAGLLLGGGGEFAFVIIGLATDFRIISPHASGLSLAVTSVSMAATPLLSYAARRLAPTLRSKQPLDPELAISPAGQSRCAIVVGYGRVGKVVSAALRENGVSYIAADRDAQAVIADRRAGHEVYFGDATDPEFLRVCGIDDAAGVIITINARQSIDEIVSYVRSIRPDIPIIARARDADHACHLYAIGATEAVPETVEASLQLSQSALSGLGVDSDAAQASVQAMRADFRRALECRIPESPAV
jgi:Kef-type K+ transport systems, membrane components